MGIKSKSQQVQARQTKLTETTNKRKATEAEIEDLTISRKKKTLKENTHECEVFQKETNVQPISDVPKVDSYVRVKYDNRIYPAKVIDVDENDEDAKVSFMEETRGKGDRKLYKWPAKSDELWVNFDQFVSTIDEPMPCGKSKRQFRLHDTEYSYINTN